MTNARVKKERATPSIDVVSFRVPIMWQGAGFSRVSVARGGNDDSRQYLAARRST